ncbi:uncharacterized protein LOC144596450 isoform X3 [Rhinoraja longicauda]
MLDQHKSTVCDKCTGPLLKHLIHMVYRSSTAPFVEECMAHTLSLVATKVIFHSFGLEDSILVLKLRNSQGSLIPISSKLNVNSKQSPYILEVVKLFQHVAPKPRTATLTVINKGLKNGLQSIMKRIERLEKLAPEIKMKWRNKLHEEMGLLNQKLHFLDQRMQIERNWRQK